MLLRAVGIAVSSAQVAVVEVKYRFRFCRDPIESQQCSKFLGVENGHRE